MKEFQYFVNKGDVKKQKPDQHTSKTTFTAGIERLQFAQEILTKQKPKFVLENAYEAMREAADSLLYAEGYKSYSHEASIAYLTTKGFSEKELTEFDRFRKIRNSIKYYGKDCDKEDAQQALELAPKIINKIKKILEK